MDAIALDTTIKTYLTDVRAKLEKGLRIAKAGVDPKKLDPVFGDFANKHQAQKQKFKGEFFPSSMLNAPNQTFVDFFQIDKFTGKAKGILLIVLSSDTTLKRRMS